MTYYSPKYWREMRKERQAASDKQQATETQASSGKHQADLSKDKPLKVHPIYQEQAEDTSDTSSKPQAPSSKHQASSRKQQAAR